MCKMSTSKVSNEPFHRSFLCADQVVQWCHVNLIHDCNQQSKDVHMHELCFQNRIIQLGMTLICISSNILLTCTCKLFMLARVFWHIGIQDIDRLIPCDASTIHGTRDLHSIKTKTFQNVFSLDSRKLTCFCPICMEDTKSIDNCESINDNYGEPWKHNEINLKGKMPLASFEELES